MRSLVPLLAIVSLSGCLESSRETDPVFAESPIGALSEEDLARWNQAASWGDHAQAGYLTASTFDQSPAGQITGADVGAWNDAHAWGDHRQAGYVTTDAFAQSIAGQITAPDVGAWNGAVSWGDHRQAGYLLDERDPRVGALSDGAVPRWNGTTLADGALHDREGRVGVGTRDPGAELDVHSRPVSAAIIGADNPTQTSTTLARSVWQSFTPTASGYLDSIDVWVSNATGYIDLTLQIFAGEGTGGALVSTQWAQVSPGTGFVSLPLAHPPILSWGSVYTFQITTDATATLSIGTSVAGYAGGRASTGATDDLSFRARMTPASNSRSTLRVRRGRVEVQDVLHFEPRDTEPPDPRMGDLYFDGNLRALRVYDGTAWRSL